ncbi:hypothetical protein QTP86_011642 [Hemibagrus guttatus]|nr:hypothetical protein QTP86_011642 [Hemibagrus guttatus]
MLSQHHRDPGKFYPCAYFSRKLTPAEANYDVGNRELLSIKEALEEWRHWLEGARHPFLVLTDHRNLQYVCNTKQLNPHQARWALFFTRFQFSVMYQPDHQVKHNWFMQQENNPKYKRKSTTERLQRSDLSPTKKLWQGFKQCFKFAKKFGNRRKSNRTSMHNRHLLLVEFDEITRGKTKSKTTCEKVFSDNWSITIANRKGLRANP